MSPAPGAGWDRVPAADALEIGTVLSRCARVVDARAWPDLDRVFTGDAVVVSTTAELTANSNSAMDEFFDQRSDSSSLPRKWAC